MFSTGSESSVGSGFVAGLFPSAALLFVVSLAVVLLGCAGSAETEVARLPFQEDAGLVEQALAAARPQASIETQTHGSPEDRSQPELQQAGLQQAELPQDGLQLAAPNEPQLAEPQLSIAQTAVVASFEWAMQAYREALSQPVEPDYPLLELTHTPATAAELRTNLANQRANRVALRYPNGHGFRANYSAVSLNPTNPSSAEAPIRATLTGCTHYRAIEFDSSNGSDLNEFDELLSFSAELEQNESQTWLLDSYVTFPLDDWGQVNCAN